MPVDHVSQVEAGARALLLVTVDGVATDELALFGGDLPAANLERLATAGTTWADAWSACPMTRPAVTTYLTGVAPDRHGVRDDLFAALASTWGFAQEYQPN